ncbi:helix-turn-helix domain-containing protein [Streptomyces sp. SID9727]|uniref:helix-turn-helix domain-containing protein n=1 Tax=Streptomyces sp. SID9727 TaxID=2706114 RepID=UPI0013C971A7|nr:helix-turn-helix domain-containing protein [Streptomyces sp. SID9727]NEC69982.1 helix-turn-helix domain-containing protein [Streptomyces sp. SID9727]
MTLSHPPQDTPAPTAPLGSLIRGHRLRIGLTQRELADLSTISVRAIRDLEKGKAQRPRTDTVRLIADALRLGPRARTALEASARRGSRADGDVRLLSMERAAPPVPLYPLVGREAETGVLVEELRSGTERLVTIVGLSGVGKTRLALEAAARLHDAGLPVLWHDGDGAAADCLRADDDPLPRFADDCARFLRGGGVPEDVLPELADAPAALDDDGSPSVRGAAVLVLDGVDTADLDFGRLSRLLRTFPGLRLLITGDRPCNVPGERLFLLSPLEAPAPAAGHADAPAVRFFLSQLRRVRPDIVPEGQALADVAWICHRLDGHPAALGAAASWLTVCDLSTLRNIVDSDPAPLLDHLAGGPDGSRLQVRVSRALATLPAPCRSLIGELGEVRDGEFLLQDVVRLTGRPLPECGRLIRELLVGGMIRTSTDGGRSAFRVLCVVRAAGSTAGV